MYQSLGRVDGITLMPILNQHSFGEVIAWRRGGDADSLIRVTLRHEYLA